MQCVILCGGKGMRAYPYTKKRPKALMMVCNKPIIEHLLHIFYLYGHKDVVIVCGHNKDALVKYFNDHPMYGMNVQLIDTGETRDTGQRLKLCEALLDDTFFVSYCDGLSDINLDNLLTCHKQKVSQGGLATMTVVPLRTQYGIVTIDEHSQAIGFQEKPILSQYWINAGIFLFEKRAFNYWPGTSLEHHVLPHLAAINSLYCYQHTQYWQSMDTYKDQEILNATWQPVLANLIERRYCEVEIHQQEEQSLHPLNGRIQAFETSSH